MMARVPVRAKICGIRSVEAGWAASEGGADYLGFVFYPPVRRYMSPTAAAAVIRALRQQGVRAAMVGLFVNEEPATIGAIAEQVELDAVQLSGHESPETLVALAAFGRPVLKTIHLASDMAPAPMLNVLDGYLAAAAGLPPWPHGERLTFLLDAAVPGQYGGTGQQADWELAAFLTDRRPCGLAGGLTPENVTAAIERVHPWLVDVSGGVETDGTKDPDKIRAFLAAAQQAS